MTLSKENIVVTIKPEPVLNRHLPGLLDVLYRGMSRGEMRIDCVEWTTHWLKIYGCEHSYTQLQLGKDFEV